jgi:hypothetical protein
MKRRQNERTIARRKLRAKASQASASSGRPIPKKMRPIRIVGSQR